MIKIIFLGATKFSEYILDKLLKQKFDIRAVFSIPRHFSISYSNTPVENYNYSNLSNLLVDTQIPFYEIDSGLKNGKLIDHYKIINEIEPDVILVMGWYYMVPKEIRDLPKFGSWGIHASLLPDYAGGAPLVWAMINGEEKAGVTLFRLGSGVDDGDIISQHEIKIEHEDTIKEVYEKATNTSVDLLVDALTSPEAIEYKVQDKTKIKVYPQRTPQDGEIDLTWPSHQIYNFIRAQSAPYPGAFIRTSDGKKIVIEKARVEDL